MLQDFKMLNVGPASSMSFKLGPGLNLITGRNGSGKSLLLDALWSNLTETSRNPTPSLVLYAHCDGGFSFYDPIRGGFCGSAAPQPSPAVLMLTGHEIWQGNQYCKGMISDLALWQSARGPEFHHFKFVLKSLSVSLNESFRLGDLKRFSELDPQLYPTLLTPSGEEVPITHVSAGVKRILSFAYMLTWMSTEHIQAATFHRKEPVMHITFLVDDIETHLHPDWQRGLLPGLLNAVKLGFQTDTFEVQTFVTTHSPLVLASVEPIFNVETDKLFFLDLVEHKTTLQEQPWSIQGDVLNWLTSSSFGLKQARSFQAEQAIEVAQSLMRGDTAPSEGLHTYESMDSTLKALLPGHDPFWPRWVVWLERQRSSD